MASRQRLVKEHAAASALSVVAQGMFALPRPERLPELIKKVKSAGARHLILDAPLSGTDSIAPKIQSLCESEGVGFYIVDIEPRPKNRNAAKEKR